jgi:hypothetical protein
MQSEQATPTPSRRVHLTCLSGPAPLALALALAAERALEKQAPAVFDLHVCIGALTSIPDYITDV